MRTFTVLCVFFVTFCALSQAESQNTQVLKDCQISAFADAVESVVVDTFGFVNTVVASYEVAVEEGVKCGLDYKDVKTLLSCIGTVVDDFTNTLMPGIQTYITNIVKASENIADDVLSCI